MAIEYGYVNVQCTAADGKVGDFISEEKEGKGKKAISPVFDDLVGLYAWMRANGWNGEQAGLVLRGYMG